MSAPRIIRQSVQDLEGARERLREVARIAPRRDCFIYSDDNGIVEIIVHADFQARNLANCISAGK